MPQQREHHSAENVVPRMRDHSWTKTPAHKHQRAKHRAVRGDRDHSRRSFITVSDTEQQRRAQNAQPQTRTHRRELSQQISAKDEFLAESRRTAEHHPKQHLQGRAGRNRHQRLLRRRQSHRLQRQSDDGQHDHRRDPEHPRGEHILHQLVESAPKAEQLRKPNVLHPQSPPHQQKQRPLHADAQTIAGHVVRGHNVAMG